jgi:putative transposase
MQSAVFLRGACFGTCLALYGYMTLPRDIHRGATYLITRRCVERLFLLVPCVRVRNAFVYCFRSTAEKYGIQLHAATLMSNHLHMVVTDTQGMISAFMERFVKEFARCVNAITGHTESVFAPRSRPHLERLIHAEDVASAIAYIVSNPAAAGICESACEWPGVLVQPAQLARLAETKTAVLEGSTTGISYLKLRKQTRLTLPIVLPPQVAPGDAAKAFVAEVKRLVSVAEERVRADRIKLGKEVYGARAAMALHWSTRAKSENELFESVPTLKCQRTPERIALLRALKEFRRAYREAWRAFRDGCHDVVFPLGTWKMAQLFGVRVAAA